MINFSQVQFIDCKYLERNTSIHILHLQVGRLLLLDHILVCLKTSINNYEEQKNNESKLGTLNI